MAALLKIYIAYCFLLAGRQPVANHPFYISVTEITYQTKTKTAEVSCKMFAEDLEQILEKDYKKILDITLEKDKPVFNSLIPDYVTHHLGIAVDGKPAVLTYVGFEKESESAFCYFTIDHLPSPKKIDISNSLLHDFNTAQINIMHVIIDGKRQSTKLDYPASEAHFTF